MKLEKAIENLEDALKDKWCPWSQDLKDSIRLGIEALEFLERVRSKAEIQPYPLLRSETLE